MAEALVLARKHDSAVARRVAAALKARGVVVHVQTRALELGRVGAALRNLLRRADAVVLLLSMTNNQDEVFWDDALVDAVRAVGRERLLPVLLGPHADDNLAWPIVADYPALGVPDLRDLDALLRFVVTMLEPDAGWPVGAATAPLTGVFATPAKAQAPVPTAVPDTLARALIAQRQALGEDASLPMQRSRRTPLDDPSPIFRWSADAQQSIVLLESLRGLGFVGDATGDSMELHSQGQLLAAMAAPGVATFERQLALVIEKAAQREERLAEILAQQEKNRRPFWNALAPLAPERRPATAILLDLACHVAGLVGMRAKHAFAIARPSDWSTGVMPLLPTPESGSFPMGTAVESYLLARLLERLASERPAWRLLAHRLSENRIVAGLNFPADAQAGRLLGLALADHLLLCMGLLSAPVARFYRDKDAPLGFEAEPATAAEEQGDAGAAVHVRTVPLLTMLGKRAVAEWQA